nr:DinB family protein [Terriglobus albidus]
MFTLTGTRKLHTWTYSSLSLVLDHLSTIPEEEYVRALPGFGLPTLRAQVIHIFNCEAFWIHTLQAARFKDEDAANWPTISDARLLQSRVGANTLAYLSGLTDEQLNTDTTLHFPDGDTAIRTPALILHHVLTHAFHHKGQIVSMCRTLGYPAPDTDLNQFE